MPDDRRWMELAVEVAAQSQSEPGRVRPLVGAVACLDGELLGSAFRGETGEGHHAEYGLLERKLGDTSVAGATVYTTLEPCTERNRPKTPCANHLIHRRIRRVVIGMLDPNPLISGKGVARLRDASIEIQLFPPDLMAKIEEMNREFKLSFEGSDKSDQAPLSIEQLRPTTLASRTLIVVAGPSAVGKDVIASRVRLRAADLGLKLRYARKFTTRKPRMGEQGMPSPKFADPGSKLTFSPQDEFESSDDIVWKYEKYGHHYGFSSQHLASKLRNDRLLLGIFGDLERLPEFVEFVADRFDRTVFVCLLTGHHDELTHRLETRKGLDAQSLRDRQAEMRLDVARIRRMGLEQQGFLVLPNGNRDNPDEVAETLLRSLLLQLNLLRSE